MLLKFLLFSLFVSHSIEAFEQEPSRATLDWDSLVKVKTREAVGMPFPAFVASNEYGTINNDSLRGKVVLINFWFEGCHPCLAEFPALNELYQTLKDNRDFELISFTWDRTEAIKRVKEKFNLLFQVYHATARECLRLNQNNGYPTTIILDRQGIIRYMIFGGPTDTDHAREYVMTELLPEIRKVLQL